MQYHKPKSVSKVMEVRGTRLQDIVLNTLKTCSDLVGATLGPGGMSVVIERQEIDMPPVVTKDGVTVFKSIGFQDVTQQLLMECARDAAVRTATEAGDGTTTATVLAYAFVKYIMEFTKNNPQIPPQRVVQILQDAFQKRIVPMIDNFKVRPTLDTEEGRRMLRSVAKVSANGEDELADAVMKCFDIVGDEGNVTILEQIGPRSYSVEKIDGYPCPTGFEECCGPFYQKFINDPGSQSCLLENPSFLLYHGKLTDFNQLWPVIGQIANSVGDEVGNFKVTHNVIVVATGFSETVLANLAAAFPVEGSLNVYPLVCPLDASPTGQFDFLLDLRALTGAQIYDPLERPLQNFELDGLGFGPRTFEATRYRTNIIGYQDEVLVFERVDQIKQQLAETLTSELMAAKMKERVAKLTSGIAKLIVQGPSHGEVKERRDRAEDAVCAVRGAVAHGALPAGGAVLMEMSRRFGAGVEVRVSTTEPPSFMAKPMTETEESKVARQVLAPALFLPVEKLMENAGLTPEEEEDVLANLDVDNVFDLQTKKYVNPIEQGLLDSVPAVKEALRSSISIAALLGTCGGVVGFPRKSDLDMSEARDTAEWLRNANVNPANERA